ncbi:MAG: hypothetical protein ACYC4A_05305 [Desulfobulbia bacterium]
MVSSIGSSGSYAMQAMQAMQQRQGPQDLFKKVDLDGSGGVSQAELKTLTEDISSKTDKTLNVDETSFASSDTDGNGALSEEELMSLMNSNGFGPPAGMEGGEAMAPPPSKDRAAAAYAANSGGDALSSLIAGLQNLLEQLQSESGDQVTSSDTASVGNDGSPHGPQDFFKKIDSDGSGGVSTDELATMAEDLQKMTGQSLTVDNDTFGAADSDGDGSLNADELQSFMDTSGFAPPPPPPEGMAMAISSDDSETKTSATQGSSQKQIDLLQIMLEQLTKLSKEESKSSTSLLDVTA